MSWFPTPLSTEFYYRLEESVRKCSRKGWLRMKVGEASEEKRGGCPQPMPVFLGFI